MLKNIIYFLLGGTGVRDKLDTFFGCLFFIILIFLAIILGGLYYFNQ